MNLSGIINIYKEPGMTSHDVVYHLRKILCMKKIGHTGTLDPAAEGVLPVALGPATRLCDLLNENGKVYRAVMRLGVTTDTQDLTGEVLSEREVLSTEEEIREAADAFTGSITQVPPMYSAVKVDGKKLYQLARKGIEVERPAREVTIDSIVIEKIDLPDVTMTVTCSKGTYIRTLCADIGERLGCGACMGTLVRLKAAGLSADDALTLDQVRECMENGTIGEHIVPTEAFFTEYAGAKVDPENDIYLMNGNPFLRGQLILFDCADGQEEPAFTKKLRLYDSEGTFAGVYEKYGRRYKPWKMFLPPRE